jgi:KRAB domain-containing zinc finger protein
MHGKNYVDRFEHYECDYDGKIFKEMAILKSHMAIHRMRVQCKICDAEIQPVYLKKHIREVHTDDRKFQCQRCQKGFKSKQKLKIHILIHNKAVKCLICSKMFPNKSAIKRHVKQIHENPGSFECETCGKKFNRRFYLKYHQKTHDKNRPKPFKCQRCDYTTDKLGHYNYHQKSHEYQDQKFAAMINPQKCEKCPAFFKNEKLLKHHMRQVHPDVPFQCDLCGKYMNGKGYTKRHIMMHLEKKNYIN